MCHPEADLSNHAAEQQALQHPGKARRYLTISGRRQIITPAAARERQG